MGIQELLTTLKKRFVNVNENRLDSTKPCVSGQRNKYLFALTKKFSSVDKIFFSPSKYLSFSIKYA